MLQRLLTNNIHHSTSSSLGAKFLLPNLNGKMANGFTSHGTTWEVGCPWIHWLTNPTPFQWCGYPLYLFGFFKLDIILCSMEISKSFFLNCSLNDSISKLLSFNCWFSVSISFKWVSESQLLEPVRETSTSGSIFALLETSTSSFTSKALLDGIGSWGSSLAIFRTNRLTVMPVLSRDLTSFCGRPYES